MEDAHKTLGFQPPRRDSHIDIRSDINSANENIASPALKRRKLEGKKKLLFFFVPDF